MTVFDPAALHPQSTDILWQGASSDAANVLTGGRVASASYTITGDAVKFASGVLSTNEEHLPLVLVRDADLKQSMTQKARGVGDLILQVDLAAAPQYGQRVILFKSIKDLASVRDIILRRANEVRTYWTNLAHERNLEAQRAGATQFHTGAHAAPTPASPPSGPSLMDQLRELGDMKTSGLLSDEEFAAAKARLLG